MESLFSLSLPFQRRLTKMYTDTKSSYDFVKESVQLAEDPELLSLHRKLRIQKDRLVSWGLEWSDPTQSPDIDESINKAGLSELVGSVMGTIKEVLAEAEPLWLASKAGGGSEKVGLGGEKDRKGSLIVWDKSRFVDLVRDLTMSIDTLYDLSRTRQSAKNQTVKSEEGSEGSEGKKRVEERQFQSTRMQTPQQIDPKSLIWPRELKSIPQGILPPAKWARQIVFMRRPSSESRKPGSRVSAPVMPVLMEYAPYDPIYSITGITPSMTRFEKLFAALSQAYISSERILMGLLHLIGYFEEAEHSRFCLLYALPTHFGPVDIETPRMPSITVLSDLLYSQNFEPSLEVKYRLAQNVASAVFDLHAKGVVHGNVVASNIMFIKHQSSNRIDLSKVNMRQSYLTSCDLFSDNATEGGSNEPVPLHRHPLDPRITRYTHLSSESKSLDLYSLAMLLLEIGLWSSLQELFPTSTIPENPTAVMKQLAARCGSLYVKAVQACWHAPEDELSQKARPDVMHQKVFWKVSKALDTCCAIDESEDESTEEESDTSPPISSTPVKVSRSPTPLRLEKSPLPPLVTARPSYSEKQSYPSKSSSPYPPEKTGWTEKPVVKTTPKPTAPVPRHEKPKPKLRTYPSIRIAQEHLDFWHTGLMPHINHVLRSFYKKYPESVEISLESIGESPTTTKPTILVICTSVTKVRSILKKSLVYDRSAFGLKVCRGKVVRSRKQGVRRSVAPKSGEAKNREHQMRPANGASIGAYVEGQHLPPVSFGGLLLIDSIPYGMSVHHMLDDPSSDSDSDSENESDSRPPLRSSAHGSMPDLTLSESSVYSSGDEEYVYTLSDYESDFSSEELDSESEAGFSDSFDNEDEEEYSETDSSYGMEPGDIKGIPTGCGESYLMTQPAIDDIPSEFYPDPTTRDEDHLDSCSLGEVHASSGIRRRTEENIIHEIDWALFSFQKDRAPPSNILPGPPYSAAKQHHPRGIVPTHQMGGLDVYCMARTSGLQKGRIGESMVVIKIYGRQTPSLSYQVASKGHLGVPGDSGAWVVSCDNERVAGHVLAWSSKKKVAYICPMDVLIRDIAETVDARSIKLPGGEELLSLSSIQASSSGNARQDLNTSLLVHNPSPVEERTQPALHKADSFTSRFPELDTDKHLDIEDELSTLLRDLKIPPSPKLGPLAQPSTTTTAQQLAREVDNSLAGLGSVGRREGSGVENDLGGVGVTREEERKKNGGGLGGRRAGQIQF